MKKNKLLIILLALVAFGQTAWAQWTGSGSSESPYLIANESDWNTLATNVNDGTTTYSGKYFKLMDNISVTNMVGDDGSNDRCFSGIFDGNGKTITFNLANATEQYIAPFRRINNATVKNLKVTGTVSSSNRFAGGIVAYAKGTSYVTDCMNSTSITINGSINNASNGGIVGMVGGKGSLTISGCVFNGEMSGGSTSNDNWCGILGLCNSNCTAYINNCLFIPASANVSGNTIHRSTGTTTVTNCYYTQSMTNNQGKQAYSISSSDVSVAFAGNSSSNTTIGVIGYNPGIKYNNVLYAGDEDAVSLSLTAPLGYKITAATYTPEGGSAEAMTQTGNVYSFTMPNANVTINAEIAYCVNYWANGDGSYDHPFEIATTDDFDMLSTLVREVPQGHPFRPYVDPDLIFYGYYFKLMNDLDYSNKTFTPVGYYSLAENIYRGFRGTFDGQGHVIKGINYETTTGAAGIFGFATGDISNLALINSNLTGGNNTGGIVGYYNGGTISNCHVASNVNIYTPTGSTIVAFHGGIVGRKFAGIISYCTSAAHIVDGCTTYGNHFGGIAGSNDSQSINHCLFTNDIVTSVYTDNKGPIAGSGNGTLTNCYWTNSSFEGSSPSTDNDNSGFITTINDLQDMMTVSTYSDDFTALAPDGYTLQKTISAWTEGTEDSDTGAGGWYLIASPVVDDIAPVAVMNLLGTQMPNSSQYNFDLYRFNQSPALIEGKYKEWENYHQHNTEGNPFRLENGKGYLYARSADTILTFTGTFNTSTQQEVELIYDPNSPHSDTRGWNLVGNPFAQTAYTDKDFYRMNYGEGNTGGNEIILAETYAAIAPMEGIFVHTDQNETMSFSTQAPDKGRSPKPEHKQLVLNLSRNRGSVIDRAIVRMGEGQTLPKFQIRENSTKLYIPQGGKDYAIAFSNGQGEMPVNFRANENGQYTISVNPENLEMAYLHLIDNMTGTDVDLLPLCKGGWGDSNQPAYTFTAKTTDYESRFKLVFIANDASTGSASDATFAFVSNGSIIINGTGTLQVFDILGRQVYSHESNSAFSIQHSAFPAGVYVLRLIDGNNVRTQKVVVE